MATSTPVVAAQNRKMAATKPIHRCHRLQKRTFTMCLFVTQQPRNWASVPRRMSTKLGHLVLATLLVVGCGRKHYLNQYDFSDKALALAWIDPPAPHLQTGLYNLRVGDNPVQTVVNAGANVAKEVEARRATARLDSAAMQVD